MPRLAITVHVKDPETGRHVVLNKGSEVPDRLVAMVSNPDVWADAKEAAEAAERAEQAAEAAEQESEESSEPPRSGKGSGRDAWVAFAADHGVHVDDEDSRDDIIAELVSAGVIEQ